VDKADLPRVGKTDQPAGTPGGEDPVRERRAAVLRAAWSVFEAKGLEEASIRLIAQAAGMTTGAIYPYFSGKEEIYAELLRESLERLHAELSAAIGASRGRKKRFRIAIGMFFSYYEARPAELSLALYLFRGLKPQGLTPQLNRQLNAKAQDILLLLRGVIQAISGLDGQTAAQEVGLQVTFLFGLLTIHHTRRSRMLGVKTGTLMALHVEQSIDRLAAGPIDGARRAI